MQMFRRVLELGLALAVVALTAVSTAAQEASPQPMASASPVPMEAETVTEPLPVADYWGEWSLHKLASRHRVDAAVGAAKNARWRVSPSPPTRYLHG